MTQQIIPLRFFILLIAGQFLLIQSGFTDDIAQIKTLYTSVKADMEQTESTKDETGKLFCNTVSENVHNGSWRAVGIYRSKVQFWYNDTPGAFCDESDSPDKEACHLMFVTQEVKSGAGGWRAEYLYDEGRLVFAFIVGETGQLRFYWKDGKLIRAQIGDKVSKTVDEETRRNAQDHWKTGQRFRKLYIDNF